MRNPIFLLLLPYFFWSFCAEQTDKGKNSTLLRSVVPQQIITKLGVIDYVRDTYSSANFLELFRVIAAVFSGILLTL